MNPPPLSTMLLFVIGTYLATYGPGRLLVQLCGVRVGSFPERLGISCAVGAVVVSWLGYVAVMAGAPWLALATGWAAMALGLVMVVRGLTWGREQCDLTRANRAVLALAVVIGLAFAAGMDYWQIAYHADGSLSGRLVWPDLLYRNAVMSRLMVCDGPPDWPWLAGEPMKGMSLLRFTALMPVMKAVGVAATHYQIAALWLGLFGVPVSACAALALFRALGAGQTVSAWAVVLTGFLGNPRWLLNERFAHSPALHWAGTDVFAVSVPVLFAMLALIALSLRCRAGACTPPDSGGSGGVRAPALQWGSLWLAVLMLASGLGHAPWKGLSVYAAVPLFLALSLLRREGWRSAAILTVGALAGLVVLKTLMGSGTAGGSLLSALGPSPTIRNLSWAFPFLSEPLRPLLADLGPAALMKLVKFVCVYAVAVGFYLWGSMWVRMVIAPNAYRFPWARLKEPVWGFGLCLVIAGVTLSTVVSFNRLAYEGAQYDVFRMLWPALLLANLAVAYLLVEKWPYLRRGWGLLLLLVLIFYGSWENCQLVLWSRTGLPVSVIGADDMASLRYVAEHAASRDVVFINPHVRATGPSSPQTETMGHGWGYASGLLPVRVWLDNEDMARKFGQETMWDGRWAEAERAMGGPPSAFRSFLAARGIGWVIAQSPTLAQTARAAGLTEAFRSGGVAVFRQGPAPAP